MKVHVLTKDLPKEVVIDSQSEQEQIKNIDEIAKAQIRAKKFNLEKGPWIYKIHPATFKKLVKQTKDFL